MDRHDFVNENPGFGGRIVLLHDRADAFVHVVGTGFVSLPQIQIYLDCLCQAVQGAHAAGRRIITLVDMIGAQAQPAEVAEHIKSRTRDLYKDGDSVALLGPAGLVRVQIRRLVDPRFHQFFEDEAAARAWLERRRRQMDDASAAG